MTRDPRAWLNGCWTVRRTIDKGGGIFSGTAEIVEVGPDESIWQESGTFTYGGVAYDSKRTTVLKSGADQLCHVRFADGADFHELNLESGAWRIEYQCKDDLYCGVYEIVGADELIITWNVAGPSKKYFMKSQYLRADCTA